MKLKMMKTKTIFYSIIAVAMLLLSGCGSDNFEIDVALDNLGTQNLRFIYPANDALHSMWMPVVDGKCAFHGSSKEYTVVEVYTAKQVFLTCLAVKNGQKVEMRGDFLKPYTIELSGNDINEEVSEVLNRHAEEFAAQKYDKTDAAIEKFAAEKRNEALATDILIKYYYTRHSDADLLRVAQMRKSESVLFNAEGREMFYSEPESEKSLTSFLLYDQHCDSITSFIPSNSKVSILYFWDNDSSSRKDVINELKNLRKTYPKSDRLQIADIGFYNDSSDWKKVVKTDSVKWQQFWGIGGRLNSEVKRMGITKAPAYLVADSTGRMLYRGESLDAACAKIDSILKPKKQ